MKFMFTLFEQFFEKLNLLYQRRMNIKVLMDYSCVLLINASMSTDRRKTRSRRAVIHSMTLELLKGDDNDQI